VTNRRNWTGWLLGVGCMLVVAAGGAAAQVVFSSAVYSSLSTAPSDALPIQVLADVGSWGSGGPAAPDGKLDLITADQSGVATVWFGNGDGTFSQKFQITLSRTPTALALGDFDGGQIPDLAITDTSGSLVLLHGNGDGTFSGFCAGGDQAGLPCVRDKNCPGSVCAFPTVLAGGRCSSSITISCTTRDDCPVGESCSAAPVALAAVDVNKDNNLDIVVVNNDASGLWVAVLLGDGEGGFSQPRQINLATGGCGTAQCGAIGVGDFNNDGSVDLAVTSRSTDSVFILRGNGSGNFEVSQTISEDPSGLEPVGIAVGDLNNDQRDDVVVVNNVSDNVGVFLAQANGTLQAATFADSGTVNSAPNGIALFDANGDGKLDVAVSNNLSSDVSVLLGDGTGGFGAPRTFVTNQEPLAVAAGDLDGDAIPDLVSLNRDNNTADAAALLGQGDGVFKGVEDVIAEPNPNAVVAGDIDNDGLPDLIVSRSVSVCSNDTTKSCSGNADCGGGNTCQPNGRLLVRRSLSNGGFAAPLALQFPGDASAMGLGDFNADGRLDIVVLNRPTPSVSMFLGGSAGFPSTPQNYPVGAGGITVTVGDWDGNGRPDVAVARQGGIDILLSNAEGALQTVGTVALSSDPLAMDWGDFNNDGHLDLALAVAGSQVVVAFGNGTGTFQLGAPVQIPGATVDASGLAVADFDGDGFDDVAALLPSQNNLVALLYNDHQGGFTAGGTLQTFFAPWALAARDLSGDLLPDLVVPLHADTHAVLPFINQGSIRQFVAQTSVPVSRSQGATTIVAADFDGDGRYDVASANDWTAGSVSVLTNIAATPIIRGDGNGDAKVTAADLVAVARKLRDGAATRVEQVGKGSYAAAPGADANGDGLVTGQDAWALAHRLFPRI
jgi:hypothetical protein